MQSEKLTIKITCSNKTVIEDLVKYFSSDYIVVPTSQILKSEKDGFISFIQLYPFATFNGGHTMKNSLWPVRVAEQVNNISQCFDKGQYASAVSMMDNLLSGLNISNNKSILAIQKIIAKYDELRVHQAYDAFNQINDFLNKLYYGKSNTDSLDR
jgi:hypothetical protein